MPLSCRLCLTGDLEPFFHLGGMPLVGTFSRDRNTAIGLPRHDLDWRICTTCGGIQLANPVEDTEVFGDDYSFSTGTVPSLVKHFDELAEQIVKWFEPSSVLEFGSNDGTLLGHLKSRGVKAVGIDPSANVAQMAQAKGHETYVGFLNRETARHIVSEHGKFDIVTGSNCFAHNVSVHPILEGVKELLKPEGILCLEVIYADDVLNQLQWDSLYHEHVYLYHLGSLSHLLKQYGMTVFDVQRVPMHAGSLRVFATAWSGMKPTTRLPIFMKSEAQANLSNVSTWKAFGRLSMDSIRIVRDVFGSVAEKHAVWGYGASGRAAMWANACGHGSFEAIVDASPLRAGRFLPGLGTPVISVDDARALPQPDFMFIYSWNYVVPIVKQAEFFNGTWATPLPSLNFFTSAQATTTFTGRAKDNLVSPEPAPEIQVSTLSSGRIETESYAIPAGKYFDNLISGDCVAPRFTLKRDDEIISTRLLHNYFEAQTRYARVFARAKTTQLDLVSDPSTRLLVIGGHSNFYHFVTNYLARAFFYLINGELRPNDLYLIDAAMPDHYRNYLELIGITREQMVPISADAYTQCKLAYFSSMPHYWDPDFGLCGHADAFRWLNDTIRKQLPLKRPHRRIMLSRRDTLHRRIVNEDELIDAAAPYGFERLVPEKHGIIELLTIIGEAEVLVTPYGAGAANVLFTSHPAQVIELAGDSSIGKFNTPALCALLGRPLTRVVGQEQQLEKDWAFRDLLIDPSDFLMAIEHTLARQGNV